MTSFLPVVIADLWDQAIRRKNLYLISGLFAFVWIIFHFIVVYFFGYMLKSALMVGLFLGFSNFIAFAVDGPFGALQKYISSKKFFVISALSMLVTALAFIKFIYFAPKHSDDTGVLALLMQFLLQDSLNILLLLLAAVLYGIAREIISITTLSYILNNTDPSEYADVMSKNNFCTGLASVIGFLVASVLLVQNPIFAVLTLIGFLIILILFVQIYFDNPYKTINFADIQRIKIINKRETIEKMKEYVVDKVTKADFVQMAKNTKFLFIKPIEMKEKIDRKEVLGATKNQFLTIKKVLFDGSAPLIILWVLIVVAFFGFWDTFVATFQVDFLDKMININKDGNLLVQKKILTGYILLGLLALPVFIFPDFFVKLSKKIGIVYVILWGILISGISLVIFGFSTSLIFIVILGLTNSIGYAASMTLGQSVFLDNYNNLYAQKYNLREIDANASAAPLMMLQNMANVVGLVVGGVLVTVLGFNVFFIVCGVFLLALFVWSLRRLKDLDI